MALLSEDRLNVLFEVDREVGGGRELGFSKHQGSDRQAKNGAHAASTRLRVSQEYDTSRSISPYEGDRRVTHPTCFNCFFDLDHSKRSSYFCGASCFSR